MKCPKGLNRALRVAGDLNIANPERHSDLQFLWRWMIIVAFVVFSVLVWRNALHRQAGLVSLHVPLLCFGISLCFMLLGFIRKSMFYHGLDGEKCCLTPGLGLTFPYTCTMPLSQTTEARHGLHSYPLPDLQRPWMHPMHPGPLPMVRNVLRTRAGDTLIMTGVESRFSR